MTPKKRAAVGKHKAEGTASPILTATVEVKSEWQAAQMDFHYDAAE
jgi:hypothetical protein